MATTVVNRQAFSRAGDRYHYVRAARLCLTMLAPKSELQRVVVESAAQDDAGQGGVDVIDLALYYGPPDEPAERIAYRQFKHSTLAANTPMTASDIAGTLRGFAERFCSLLEIEAQEGGRLKHEFEFETNRPISPKVVTAIQDLVQGSQSRESSYLRANLDIEDGSLSAFAGRIRLLERTGPLPAEAEFLSQDTARYLPGGDQDVRVRLVEMIAEKAARSEAADLEMRRLDVLRAMQCTEERALLPASRSIQVPKDVVRRPIFSQIVNQVVRAGTPVILEASGGVGKSVATMLLGQHLPEGSVCIVYDCFADGSYRNPANPRHEPRQAYVQLSNELAFDGRCDPLVPLPHAHEEEYVRAFFTRLEQAAEGMAHHPDAVLLVVVDAADNAEIVARDLGRPNSFASGLLRTSQWHPRVRVLLTARPERVELLDPPPGTLRLTLPPFDCTETADHLRSRYPKARDTEVAAFHRLTSANPRVQRRAMEVGDDVEAILDRLGPKPLTVDHAIDGLLDGAIAKFRDDVGAVQADQIDRACSALAVLRPFVPLRVVADVADVNPSFVRTLASELGAALRVTDDAVQFTDEPTETWFRTRFGSDRAAVARIVDRLRPLAQQSAYAARALPHLLLGAGQLDEVINLALTDDALPETDGLGRREVKAMRLRAATRAALQAGRHADAAKLAFKTAGVEAAETRKNGFLSENPDLAAQFLSAERTSELIASRRIGGGDWHGSDNAHQAALLAGYPQFRGEAFGSVRACWGWLQRHLGEERQKDSFEQRISIDNEITAIAWAQLQLRGADACAYFLRIWQPRSIAFDAGRRIASRLADAGRSTELLDLITAAGNDVFLGSAVIIESHRIGVRPQKPQVRRLFRMVNSKRVRLEKTFSEAGYLSSGEDNEVIVALSVAALRADAIPRRTVAGLLNRYLPPYATHDMVERWPTRLGRRDALLRGFALRAEINGRPLDVERLCPPAKKKGQPRHPSAEEVKRGLGALVPWYRLWAKIILGRLKQAEVAVHIEEADREATQAMVNVYHDHNATLDDRTLLHAEILLLVGAGPEIWGSAADWDRRGKRQRLSPAATCGLIRLMAHRQDLHGLALALAADLASWLSASRDMAESAVETRLDLSRALLSISEAEARAHFEGAADIAERLGEENQHRWHGMLSIAEVAGQGLEDRAELAYRLSRFAEPSYEHMAKHSYLDWDRTVRALAALSPTSCLAILSRWADRGFCRVDGELDVALKALWKARHIDGEVALCLYPAHGHAPGDALEAGLSGGADRAAVADIAARYIEVEEQSSATWARLRKVAEHHGFGWGWPREAEARATLREEERDRASRGETLPKEEIDWTSLLEGLDLLGMDGIRKAMRRAKGSLAAWDLWQVLVKRVPPGREADFLHALLDMPELSPFDLHRLLEAMPDAWAERAAVPEALRKVAEAVCRRWPYDLHFSFSWAGNRTLGVLAAHAGRAMAGFG